MSENTTALDLDKLVPEPKKVKFNGRVVDCYPPTLRQLIALARFEDDIQDIKTPDEAIERVKKVIEPLIPEIKTWKKFDINMGQLRVLIQYLQQIAAEVNTTAQEVTPKKKVDSPKG